MSRPLKDPKGKTEKIVNAVLKSLRKLQQIALGGYLSEEDAKIIDVAIQPEIKKIHSKVKLKKSLNDKDNPFKL